MLSTPEMNQKRSSKPFMNWLKKRLPKSELVTLSSRRIFILPNRRGLFFCFFAIIIFILAVNFENSLIHGLCFFMMSYFVVALLSTYKNFSGLSFSRVNTKPIFVGETGSIPLTLYSSANRPHFSLELSWHLQPTERVKVVSETIRVEIPYCPTKRGEHSLGFLKVQSQYPTGLFKVWSFVDLDWVLLVYPKPEVSPIKLSSNISQTDDVLHTEEDDFKGLNNYQPGDPLRRIAWKNVAKGQGVYIKAFHHIEGGCVWLDWDDLVGDVEKKLSILSGWILQLDKEKNKYGIDIPGLKIVPGFGDEHKMKCLTALAKYPMSNHVVGES